MNLAVHGSICIEDSASFDLLYVALNQFRGHWLQVPEQPAATLVGAGGEGPLAGRRTRRIVAARAGAASRADRPNSLYAHPLFPPPSHPTPPLSPPPAPAPHTPPPP